MKLARLLNSVGHLARQRPKDVAIHTDSVVWTYHDLWRSSEEASARLTSMDLPAQARTAVLATRSAETVALLLALGMRGHTPLIVSPTLGSMAKTAVFQSARVACELVAGNVGPGGSFGVELTSRYTASGPEPETTDTDAPLLLTTSGTTGVPKAVELSADGVERFFDWSQEYFGIGTGIRVLSYAPLNFDLSLLEVWAALDGGATVVLVDQDRVADGDYLRRTLQETTPDVVQAVPMFFSLLAQGGEKAETSTGTFPARHVILTGDAASQELRRGLAGIFPDALFHNVYGCTETNDSLIYTCTPGEVGERGRLPIGTPIQGVGIRIVDDAGNNLEGAGQGELWACTPFQAHGYTDPELTRKAFVECEGPQGVQRFYRSGDRVERDENGTIHLIGRTDLVVKVRGVRTNLQDVEHALALHPLVLNAVVVPVGDITAGSVLHAIIQIPGNASISSLDIRKHCAEHLPYTAIPSRYSISSNPLPLTSTGKPDRHRLSARLLKAEGNLHEFRK